MTRVTWRSWLVESGIEPQAGDEGDRLGEPPTAIQELQGRIPAVGHSHDLALGIPAPHQEQQLPRPVGELLVALALLFGVTLGVGQGAQERQGPNPRDPGYRHQKRQAHPSESAGFDEVLAAGAHRVTVDAFGRNLLPSSSPFFPRRLSSVSSMPNTSGPPSGTKASLL